LARLERNLRTPINHIIGYSEILLEEMDVFANSLPTSIIEDLQRIHFSGKQLLTHIDTLFKNPVHTIIEDLVYKRYQILWHLRLISMFSESLQTRFTEQQQTLSKDVEKISVAGNHLILLIEHSAQWWETGELDSSMTIARLLEQIEYGQIIPVVNEKWVTGIPLNIEDNSLIVLIVDDNENNRDILSRRLKSLGYKTECAVNGLEALEKLRLQNFDLVLLDIIMPVLDGFQTLIKIRQDASFYNTAVIMISSIDEISMISACIETGADDYLPNFFDPVLLRSRIGISLARKKLRISEQQLMNFLQRELQTASLIQANMLPSRFPLFPECTNIDVFASMVPARIIGGDFYDAFFIQHNLLFLCIGDVSGKGVPAAMLMVQSMTHLRSYALRHKCPSEILFLVNNLLCHNNDAGMFVTIFCGILNVDSGEFCYSNAGHLSPLLEMKDGSFDFIVIPSGSIAGIIENTTYQPMHLTLNSNQALFLYTDGVTDTENRQQHLYSEHRLQRILSFAKPGNAKAVIDNVKSDLLLFAEGSVQSDDVTMLAIRYLGVEKNKDFNCYETCR
jgi:serine phosphatase RsbU (regulator of sigma subunit)